MTETADQTVDTVDKLAKHRRIGTVKPKSETVSEAVAETEAATKTDTLKPYKAYDLSKDAKRHLEIRKPFPDMAECPLNSMIYNIQGEWRMGLGVTILYGNPTANTMVIKIVGENLQELFTAIQDWKVQWIEPFDPRFHAPVTDDKAPFIKSVEIHTERPEPVPPPSKRH